MGVCVCVCVHGDVCSETIGDLSCLSIRGEPEQVPNASHPGDIRAVMAWALPWAHR